MNHHQFQPGHQLKNPATRSLAGSVHVLCAFCNSGSATHCTRGASKVWLCDNCGPPSANRDQTLQRMADALLLQARLASLDLRNFRSCWRHLIARRFDGLDVIDLAERAMSLARGRLADGELASHAPIPTPCPNLWGFA